jgi:hypothetical protein
MRRLIESLTPGDQPISWTWIGGMFAFYVAVMAAAVTIYVNHPTPANLAQKTGATVATGSAASMAGERGSLRNLQHVVHYQEDARVQGSE